MASVPGVLAGSPNGSNQWNGPDYSSAGSYGKSKLRVCSVVLLICFLIISRRMRFHFRSAPNMLVIWCTGLR